MSITNAANFNLSTYTDSFRERINADNTHHYSPVLKALIRLETLVEKVAGEIFLFYATVFEGATRFTKHAAPIKEVFEKLVAVTDRPELDYSIRVIKSSSVNAFCVPGGKIFITAGMLSKLHSRTDVFSQADGLKHLTFEDKLAGVLGHELAHVTRFHYTSRSSLAILCSILFKTAGMLLPFVTFNLAKHNCYEHDTTHKEHSQNILSGSLHLMLEASLNLVLLFFSRKMELEADQVGMTLAAKAGYNPRGSLWVQHYLLEVTEDRREDEPRRGLYKIYYGMRDMTNTHPSSGQRLVENRKTVNKLVNEGWDVGHLEAKVRVLKKKKIKDVVPKWRRPKTHGHRH